MSKHNALLTLALFGCLLGTTHAATPQGGYRLLHRDELPEALAGGAKVVEDYGSVLWVRSGAAKAADDALTFALQLGERRFDPAHDDTARQRAYGNGAALRLVQFAAPPRQIWLDDLVARGVKPLQYIAPYSYVVWADASALDSASRQTPQLRFSGDFLPQYKQNAVADGLRRGEQQWQAMLARDAAIELATLTGSGAQVTSRAAMDAQFELIAFTIRDAAALQRLAELPGVYSLQPVHRDGGKRGELANQITANNFSGANQPIVGYLPWLAGLGVNGAGVIIANVDGGIFDTHPDLVGRMLPCTGDTCGGSATDAHGTHTAAIMAGDGSSGVNDAAGFRRGLGMAPGAKLVEQVYDPTFTQAGGMLKLMRQSHDNNADLSGNSWGPAGSPVGYDADTRQVDVGVRDTKPDIAGDQPLTYVLSFMNGNGGTSSQGSPDEAKNVITVGSTKAQTGAGAFIADYNDISANSAHGPALDGRRIPHLVAPGCSVDSANSATGYGTLCGTSMASPQVSGAVALFIDQYRDNHGGATPSAALIKAALVAASQNLAGFDDADGGVLGNRPDSKQGWGRLRADWLLAPGVPVRYYDQDTRTFDNTGESWTLTVSPQDPAKPVQVVLVYTDAPGHGTGGNTPAWNNDLDLRVTAAGTLYRGNVFGANGFSATGGSADNRNNIESVVLDAPTAAAGGLVIDVVASTISANALPNSGDATDQDFALVCVNCASEPSFTLATDTGIASVCAESDASLQRQIDVSPLLGFSAPVTLNSSGVAPAVGSFSVNPVTTLPGTSVFTLPLGSVPSGNQVVQITGTSGAITRTLNLPLFVARGRVASPALQVPAAAATNVAATVQFQWAAVNNAFDYEIVIARDANFTDIITTATTRDTQFTPSQPLPTGAVIHWRVSARNSCGLGMLFGSGFEDGEGGNATSVPRSFTTAAAPGDCPVGSTSTVVFSDTMDSGAPGWTSSGTGNSWALNGGFVHSGASAYRGLAATVVSDQRLLSPTITLPAAGQGLFLKFWNRQHLERRTAGGCYDGGLLEIAIGGSSTFTQITSGLLTDPYDGALQSGNPAAPAMAWCGDPQEYLQSVVDLAPYADQSVQLRFRLTSDTIVARADGWAIDDVQVVGCGN